MDVPNGSLISGTPLWAKWMLGLFGTAILFMFNSEVTLLGDIKEVKTQNVALQVQLTNLQTQVSNLQGQIINLYARLSEEKK